MRYDGYIATNSMCIFWLTIIGCTTIVMFHEVGIVVKLAEMAMQTRTFLIGTPVQFAELVAISDYQRDLEAIFKCMS